MSSALGRKKKAPPDGRRITNRGLSTGGFVLPVRHGHPLAWAGNLSQHTTIRARQYRALTRRLFKRKIAPCDLVAYVHAYRAAEASDLSRLQEIDQLLTATLLPQELRQSSAR